MRLLRLVPLLVLPALFLGATCVTRVDQEGPAGPWVGEVTNNGAEAMKGGQVLADIADVAGNEYFAETARTCPLDVQPGQNGTFELALPDHFISKLSALNLPIKATFFPFVHGDDATAQPPMQGVTVRVLSRDEAENGVLAEIRNDSSNNYGQVAICANIRSPSGDLLAVGYGRLFPTTLKAGEVRTVPLSFNSLPDGSYEFFATSSSSDEGWTRLSSSEFHVISTKVVASPDGMQMLVVGEVDNRSGTTLSHTQVQVFLKGSTTLQTVADAGCNGIIAAGDEGPATLILPLDHSETPDVTPADIQGIPSERVLRLSARDVTVGGTLGGQGFVDATIDNPSNSYFHIDGICFNFRDSNGTLIGTDNGDYGGDIPPGGSFVVRGAATVSGEPQSAEVFAYGHSETAPPTYVPGPPLS